MRRNLLVATISLSLAAGLFVYSLYSALTPYVISELVACAASLFILLVSIAVFMQIKKEKHRLLALEKRFEDVQTNLVQYISKSDNLFNFSNVGIVEIELDGRIINANMAFCELFRFDHDMLSSVNLFEKIDEHSLNELQPKLQALIQNKAQFIQMELQCYQKNNNVLWLVSNFSIVRNIDNESASILIQMQNVTTQKSAEDRLKYMAYHDPLTGLPNRHKLEQFLNHILATSRRHQRKFALLFFDLDHFKNINDTVGHEAGDALLQIVAERLKSLVRSSDIVARLGGDEFVLTITDIVTVESIAVVAKKMLETIKQPITIKGKEIYITFSIGISIYPDDGKTISILMKNADLALYRAKDQGRNNYQFYTHEMTYRAQSKMDLQNALAHALAKNEFSLEFQPVMDLKTRAITSVEALLRWKNDDFGLITPKKIIELSEESGLIIPVSQWVTSAACAQLKHWHNMGFTSLTISVNCSSRQFKQSNLVNDLLSAVSKAGLQPHSLAIEVTEVMIMSDPENIISVLHHLKDLGFKIVIDDFGTGYWSLNHLRRIKVDQIKVDRSFIEFISEDGISQTIVSAILAMVSRLGITSVAEGVENKEQYQFLEEEGCHEVQGYYITKPVNAERMTSFLQHPVPDAEKINQEESLSD